jgi:hypothetical protein
MNEILLTEFVTFFAQLFLESVLSNLFGFQGNRGKDKIKKWKTLSFVMYLVFVFSETKKLHLGY